MKKFGFIMFFIVNTIFGQNLLIEYSIDIVPIDLKHEKLKDVDPQILNHLKKTNKNNELVSNIMKIYVVSDGNNFSMHFKDVMPPDGMELVDMNIARGSFFSGDMSYGCKDELFIYKKDYPDYLVREIESDVLNWEILPDKKEIAGYTCYKAIPTFKKEFQKTPKIYALEYVWFAPEINYVATPSFFGNTLPGAVLGYKTKLSEATATKVKKTEVEIEILSDKNKKVLSYVEFNKYIEKYSKKLMGIN